LKFNKSLNAKFFSFIRYDLEYRLKQIPTGMGIPHLNPQELKNFMCPIPPKSEQQEIAKYLDQKTTTIDAIVHNIGKQVETLKQLRKTLINDVVTGKIKVVN
jgi:restriction endonuclease S subunit